MYKVSSAAKAASSTKSSGSAAASEAKPAPTNSEVIEVPDKSAKLEDSDLAKRSDKSFKDKKFTAKYKMEVMSVDATPPMSPPIATFTSSDFKVDKFAKRRGESKMLQLFCVSCNEYIMTYQKDGAGQLLRCYLDRIHHPDKLSRLQSQKFDVKTAPNLSCDNCTTVVGAPMLYQFEKRPAIRLIQDRVYHKPLKLR